MLEQSIKLATDAYVFEPNVASTWARVTSALTNFLTSQWSAGALAGATPAAAFSVECGLGTTMTSDDILKGIMNISVKVAISHPAEFIVITIQQQMQTA
jgi:phage tail sheath protein FI